MKTADHSHSRDKCLLHGPISQVCLRSSPILKLLTSISFENKFLKRCLDHRMSVFSPTFCRIPLPSSLLASVSLCSEYLVTFRIKHKYSGIGKKRYLGLLFYSLCFCPSHTVLFRSWALPPSKHVPTHRNVSRLNKKYKCREAEPRPPGICAWATFVQAFPADCTLSIVDDDCADVGSRVFSPHPSAVSWAGMVSNRMTLAASTCPGLFPPGISGLTNHAGGSGGAAVLWR